MSFSRKYISHLRLLYNKDTIWDFSNSTVIVNSYSTSELQYHSTLVVWRFRSWTCTTQSLVFESRSLPLQSGSEVSLVISTSIIIVIIVIFFFFIRKSLIVCKKLTSLGQQILFGWAASFVFVPDVFLVFL